MRRIDALHPPRPLEPMPTERRFIVQREVIETIEIDAPTEEEAINAADATPIALWMRDVKSEEVIA